MCMVYQTLCIDIVRKNCPHRSRADGINGALSDRRDYGNANGILSISFGGRRPSSWRRHDDGNRTTWGGCATPVASGPTRGSRAWDRVAVLGWQARIAPPFLAHRKYDH